MHYSAYHALLKEKDVLFLINFKIFPMAYGLLLSIWSNLPLLLNNYIKEKKY